MTNENSESLEISESSEKLANLRFWLFLRQFRNWMTFYVRTKNLCYTTTKQWKICSHLFLLVYIWVICVFWEFWVLFVLMKKLRPFCWRKIIVNVGISINYTRTENLFLPKDGQISFIFRQKLAINEIKVWPKMRLKLPHIEISSQLNVLAIICLRQQVPLTQWVSESHFWVKTNVLWTEWGVK